MSNFQIAISGVEAGTFGNNKQIPTFTVDNRGRITWAANVDIANDAALTIKIDEAPATSINLSTEELHLKAGAGIQIKQTGNEFEFSLSSADGGVLNTDIRGNVSGNLNGDVYTTGVSQLLVDAQYNHVGNISTTFTAKSIKNTGSIDLKSPNADPVTIYGIKAGGAEDNPPGLNLKIARGTLDAPEDMSAGDIVGGIRVNGYNDYNFKFATAIVSQFATDANMSAALPKSRLIFATGSNTGLVTASFDGSGVFTAPVIQPGVYATSADRDVAIPSPKGGMMVYVTNESKFYGYVDAGGWTALN